MRASFARTHRTALYRLQPCMSKNQISLHFVSKLSEYLHQLGRKVLRCV